jgi:hypothetical protein
LLCNGGLGAMMMSRHDHPSQGRAWPSG